MSIVLTLSIMIASIPVTLSMFFDPQDKPYGNFENLQKNNSSSGGKILPMLAQK